MLNETHAAILAECPLFKNIKQSIILSLLSNAAYQLRNFKKNTLITSRCDECKALSIVISGSIKAEMLDFSGKLINIEDIGAPLPYAVAFLFGEKNFYPVDVIARENSEILMIPKQSVLEMMQNNQLFLQNFLDIISTKTQFLSDKIWFISFRTIRQKIIHYFLEITDNGNKSVKLIKTQQELSDFFGVTRPSLARVISDLSADKLINIEKKELTVINRSQLIDEIK